MSNSLVPLVGRLSRYGMYDVERTMDDDGAEEMKTSCSFIYGPHLMRFEKGRAFSSILRAITVLTVNSIGNNFPPLSSRGMELLGV